MSPVRFAIRRGCAAFACAAGLIAGLAVPAAVGQSLETVTIRGRPQTLHLYGARGRPPVVVSSGDGGWMHLGPHVAELLAAHGYFVVGFDAKAYLSGFTSGKTTLKPEDEPGDYRMLADLAARGSSRLPVLIGVSEGAGLSVLAATDAATKSVISGVIGLGMPDRNELGWRWMDSAIYVTHGQPNEPTFSTAKVIDRRLAAAAGRDPRDTRRIRSARGSQAGDGRRPGAEATLDRDGLGPPFHGQPGRVRPATARRHDLDRERRAPGGAMNERLRQALPALIGLLLFLVALAVLRFELRAVRWHEITRDVLGTSPLRLALAVLLTALNYLGTDRLRPDGVRLHRQDAATPPGCRGRVPGLRGLQQRRFRDAVGRVGALPLLLAMGRDGRGAVANRLQLLGHVLAGAVRPRRHQRSW